MTKSADPLEPLLLGIDVGSTNVKAAVFDRSGRQIGLGSAPMLTHVPRPGRAYYLPEEIWSQVVRAVRSALEQLSPGQRSAIAGVSVASIGESGVPLDRHGEPVHEVIAWFDTRTTPQVDWLDRTFGRDRLFATTGLSLQPIWSLCKLLWLKEEAPDAWHRTARWLHVADYVAYRLCGVPATDYSLASRTSALDITSRVWHEEILRECEVDPSVLAPLVDSGTRLDTVTREASEETGLPTSAVVCAGGHDHVVGALGAGVTAPGQLLNSLGTAEAMFVPLEAPISDPRMGTDGYAQGCHVVPGAYYVFASLYTSGASITWFGEVFGDHLPIDALIAEAEGVPPGSHGVSFLPHLRLASPPHDDARSRGAFVGLHTDTKRDALFRAVLEGLALEARQSLQGLERYGVMTPEHAIAIGGGSRNHLLMQIKSSSLGLPYIVADIVEATALGAAMLGGIGAGVYRDTTDAVASVDVTGHRVEPRSAEAQIYNRLYTGVFRRLYPTLSDLSHAVDAFLADNPEGEHVSTVRGVG